ncbi:uncharacterized protein [Ambystoma mexicanum]|uniref:uncharacterized protein n=1 Tax=Ambystoma mexicanum TaxID=8296 RepID=UPI0037E88A96
MAPTTATALLLLVIGVLATPAFMQSAPCNITSGNVATGNSTFNLTVSSATYTTNATYNVTITLVNSTAVKLIAVATNNTVNSTTNNTVNSTDVDPGTWIFQSGISFCSNASNSSFSSNTTNLTNFTAQWVSSTDASSVTIRAYVWENERTLYRLEKVLEKAATTTPAPVNTTTVNNGSLATVSTTTVNNGSLATVSTTTVKSGSSSVLYSSGIAFALLQSAYGLLISSKLSC